MSLTIENNKQTFFHQFMLRAYPSQILLVLTLSMTSCSEMVNSDVADSSLEKSERNYTLIRDDLYRDDLGEVYHRTIDASAADNLEKPENGKVYSYRNYARLDTVIDGKDTYICLDLKNLVDTASFHRVPLDTPNVNYSAYEDLRMHYYLKHVADGGTLNATRKEYAEK